MPPLLLFLNSKDMVIIAIVMIISIMGSHGFIQGLGFFVSSMRPDMFFRKRLCMFFSSISLSLQSFPMSTWGQRTINWQSQSQFIFQTCTTCCWAFGMFGILWSVFVRIEWTMRVLSTWLYHQWDEWDWGRWGWHQTSPSLHLKSQAVALLMWRTGLPDLTRGNYLWFCNDNDTDLKSWET